MSSKIIYFIIKYIKKIFITLGCNNQVTYGKFYTVKSESRLMEYLEANDYELDETIQILIQECITDELLRRIICIKNIHVDELDQHHDGEFVRREMDEIFWQIINYIGINQMRNLSELSANQIIDNFWIGLEKI